MKRLQIDKRKELLCKPGFTLIELIITIGILGIVLASAYSMGLFGYKTFSKGSIKSNIQSDITLAANYISNELRYASKVTILTTVPSTGEMDTDESMEYIYIDTSDGILKHHSNGKTEKIAFGNDSNITCTIQFKENDFQTLYFKLTGNCEKENYTLDSSVLLLNTDSSGISGADSGIAVSYYPAQPVNKVVNKPVEKIEISGPDTVSTQPGTYQYGISVLPEDATIKSVSWSIVPGSSIASIDQNGLLRVSSNTAGSTFTIKAIANDGSGIADTYVVTTSSEQVIPELKDIKIKYTSKRKKDKYVDHPLTLKFDKNTLNYNNLTVESNSTVTINITLSSSGSVKFILNSSPPTITDSNSFIYTASSNNNTDVVKIIVPDEGSNIKTYTLNINAKNNPK